MPMLMPMIMPMLMSMLVPMRSRLVATLSCPLFCPLSLPAGRGGRACPCSPALGWGGGCPLPCFVVGNGEGQARLMATPSTDLESTSARGLTPYETALSICPHKDYTLVWLERREEIWLASD